MTRERRRPTSTAYHEAGHAVACWALAIPISFATIVSGPDYAGLVKHARGHDPDRVMVVAFAGPAAQRRSHPRSDLKHDATADHAFVSVAAEVVFAALHDRQHGIRRADREARAIVDRHWFAVDQVARELMRRGGLSGFAIVDLIREAEEEWTYAQPSRPGVTPFAYARERALSVQGLSPLRRSHVEAAALRALLAGAGDVEAAIGADLVGRGYRAAEVAALLQRIRSTAA